MKILSLMNYDQLAKVDARDLQRLIAEQKVIAFRRASGWVRVSTDRVRGAGGDYPGPERREIRQKPAAEPANGFHFCCLKRELLS
jgi:hypothetical protein